jgi:hypothetical protein
MWRFVTPTDLTVAYSTMDQLNVRREHAQMHHGLKSCDPRADQFVTRANQSGEVPLEFNQGLHESAPAANVMDPWTLY